jgi:hypothetical protein
MGTVAFFQNGAQKQNKGKIGKQVVPIRMPEDMGKKGDPAAQGSWRKSIAAGNHKPRGDNAPGKGLGHNQYDGTDYGKGEHYRGVIFYLHFFSRISISTGQ